MSTRIFVREVHLLEVLYRYPTPTGKQPSLDYLPDELLDEWCQKPFTHLWAMGAWRRSTVSKKIATTLTGLISDFDLVLPDWREDDVSGSPYSVYSYEPSRKFGSKQAFQQFRSRLANRGVKLILDFIPNHVAVDHPWVQQFPNRFVMRNQIEDGETPPIGWFEASTAIGKCWIAHGRDPYFPSWTDTAQLDYRNQETRKEMINQLLQISEYCDGVRCDMAMLVLNNIFRKTWGDSDQEKISTEFWATAIDTVHKKKPSFLFIAETYWGTENRLIELGFDYVYDKEFMSRVIHSDVTALKRTLLDRRSWGQRYIRFLENHDEKRIASQVSKQQLDFVTSLLLMQPAAVLWHDGQEKALQRKIPIQLTRRPTENVDVDFYDYVKSLFKKVSDFPFHLASARQLGANPVTENDTTNSNLIPILWEYKNRRILWIGNLTGDYSTARVPIHLAGIADRLVTLNEMRTNEVYGRSGSELLTIGLFVHLEPYSYHWFEVMIERQ